MLRLSRQFTLFALTAILVAPAWAQAAEPPHLPVQRNVVLITADNLGYGDVGCYGNAKIKTPRIDRLATEGVRCTDFYTASPTCTVSRACLLTGRYPQRHGLTDQLAGLKGNYGVGLNQKEFLIPQYIASEHLRTACFGKWNIGFARGSRPTERGFHEFFGHASGNIDYYTHVYNGRHDMHRGIAPVRVKGYCTDLFADAACEFIRRNSRKSFFIYLPLNAPHFPNAKNKQPGEPVVWQAPPRAFEAYGFDPNTTDEQQRYYAVVNAMDEAVGRVLDQLDESNLRSHTLVIFFSDNGAFMLTKRGLEVASNHPLRDGGVTLWEGGIRTPCVVRWPGELPADTVCRAPLLSCDFLPMILRATDRNLPENLILDGRDPTAALAGKSASPHEALFFAYRGYEAVRSGNYKLIRTPKSKAFQLFDLANDIGETKNIASEKPEVVAKLEAQFRKWQTEMKR